MKIQITIHNNMAAVSTEDGLHYYADDAQLTQIEDSNNSDELWQAYKNVQHRGNTVVDWTKIKMYNIIDKFYFGKLVSEIT